MCFYEQDFCYNPVLFVDCGDEEAGEVTEWLKVTVC